MMILGSERNQDRAKGFRAPRLMADGAARLVEFRASRRRIAAISPRVSAVREKIRATQGGVEMTRPKPCERPHGFGGRLVKTAPDQFLDSSAILVPLGGHFSRWPIPRYQVRNLSRGSSPSAFVR
jgi:hypothetical protein